MHEDARPWIALSDEDLQAAEAVLRGRLFRHVSLCCEQAVEKRLKAVIAHTKGKMPPRTHDLMRLAEMAGLEVEEAVQDFLDDLTDDYFTQRYPTAEGKLPEAQDEPTARRTLEETRRIVAWLDQLLK
jgi:HEPN domain-containing protein